MCIVIGRSILVRINTKEENSINMKKSMNNILATYMAMAGGLPITNRYDEEAERKRERQCGEGIELVPVPEDELGELDPRGKRTDFSYLYKDGKKLSDDIFRKGGMGGTYKDGYIGLMKYNPETKSENDWVMVDTEGNVVYTQKNRFGSLYHQGGIIVSDDNKLYNIKTGDMIVDHTAKISSRDFLFVEVIWSSNGFESGVYKIDKQTAEIEFFERK
jgi:hypothetical protein